MELLLFIAVFIFVVGALATKLNGDDRSSSSSTKWEMPSPSGKEDTPAPQSEPQFLYKHTEELFTRSEWHFYQALRQATPDLFVIFGKVRVADVLTPKNSPDRSRWQSSFNKISGKHFDFVLCEAHSGRTVCGIELNDRSHQRKNRQDRDAFVIGACENARFPLLVIPTSRHYDIPALGAQIREAIVGDAHPLAAPPLPTAPEARPGCPECGSPLMERTAQRGQHAGKVFLFCANETHCQFYRAR